MSKLPTKGIAIATFAIFILMAFSFTLVPNEGARSPFLIELADDEGKLKIVGNTTGSQVSYDLEISSTNNDGATHEIVVEVANDTYAGGSEASHWAFTFPDADSVSGGKATYNVNSGSTVSITCTVTFNSNTGGEKVTFTLDARQDPTNSNNFTYLSETDGGDGDIHEYLTVTARTGSAPFMEPAKAEDRQEKIITTDPIYSINMINLGSEDDQISITGIEVWQDVNNNGVIDEPLTRADGLFDILNEYVEVIVKTSTGAPYELNQEISLEPMQSEEFKVELVPAKDNEKVPEGSYLTRLMIYSETGDITSECKLKAYMPEITKPDFSITSFTLSSNDVEEDDSVTINAVIGIDWEYSGSVSYGFYVDNVLIGDKESFDFSESDTSKDVSTMWTAKTGSNDDRIIKIKVDLDNEFSEQDETNNEESETIIVTAPEDGFPWWIVFVVVIGVAAAGAGYWWFVIAGGTGGELKINTIIIEPIEPTTGEKATIKVVIRNDGSTIKGDEHTVLVSFYEDYEAIGDRTIDLTVEDFENGTIREVTLDWEPEASGLHTLNVAVDLDDEENDVNSMDVEIKE